MRLRFLGTRGEIDVRSLRHVRHSSLFVDSVRGEVMLDCGADWLGELERLRPDAVVLTHAHPDHAAGVKEGAPCPVYATAETWSVLARRPIEKRVEVVPGEPFEIGALRFVAFPVEHSLRAPAVGYRVARGGSSFVYLPDVARIADPRATLAGIDLYVGDGASITRPILRRRDAVLIGHASIRTQLDWCAEGGVRKALFTHCGSQIVKGDEQAIAQRVHDLGRAVRVQASIASDGLEIDLAKTAKASRARGR